MNKNKFRTREEAMANGWTGDNWTFCGCSGSGPCPIVTCTFHPDAARPTREMFDEARRRQRNLEASAPTRCRVLGREESRQRMSDERLREIAEHGESCTAQGIDVMDPTSSRGLGEMARELLEARERIKKLEDDAVRLIIEEFTIYRDVK